MQTTFSAPDISCGGCANAIKNALGKLDGIQEIAVDVEKKTVTVRYDTPTAKVLTALDNAGFPATAQ